MLMLFGVWVDVVVVVIFVRNCVTVCVADQHTCEIVVAVVCVVGVVIVTLMPVMLLFMIVILLNIVDYGVVDAVGVSCMDNVLLFGVFVYFDSVVAVLYDIVIWYALGCCDIVF